jgi:hypothetical protein
MAEPDAALGERRATRMRWRDHCGGAKPVSWATRTSRAGARQLRARGRHLVGVAPRSEPDSNSASIRARAIRCRCLGGSRICRAHEQLGDRRLVVAEYVAKAHWAAASGWLEAVLQNVWANRASSSVRST